MFLLRLSHYLADVLLFVASSGHQGISDTLIISLGLPRSHNGWLLRDV